LREVVDPAEIHLLLDIAFTPWGSRSRRVPREPPDAPEDLPKEAPGQVPFGYLEDEVPDVPNVAATGLEEPLLETRPSRTTTSGRSPHRKRATRRVVT
jgi:hypothetical protein